MILTLGSLPGHAVVAALADRWGRKPAFAFFFVGGALSAPFIFLIPWTLTQMLFLLPVLGFFTLGTAGFQSTCRSVIPTRLRTTGAGFCFNIGRIVSAAGPFLTGVVVLYTGSFEQAISVLSLVYPSGPSRFCSRGKREGSAWPSPDVQSHRRCGETIALAAKDT